MVKESGSPGRSSVAQGVLLKNETPRRGQHPGRAFQEMAAAGRGGVSKRKRFSGREAGRLLIT
jgi:hypothetical protein